MTKHGDNRYTGPQKTGRRRVSNPGPQAWQDTVIRVIPTRTCLWLDNCALYVTQYYLTYLITDYIIVVSVLID